MGLKRNYWNADECGSFSALHHASRHGLKRVINWVLESGIYSVNELTRMGTTPVIHAAADGHVLTTRGLLARGANPHLRNWYGEALHCAIESNNAAPVRELVRWGMDPEGGVGQDGRTYLSCAMDEDAAEAFAALVDLGAEIVLHSARGPHSHMFFTAVLYSCDEIVALMLERGWADIGMRDPVGLTAVHYAAASGNWKTVINLLEAGADIDAMDEGQTALDCVELEGNKTMARLLLDLGATPSGRTQR
ncbi:ankyrin [Penicillium soppii]|uniref:ankyrin n=1 Tax=Penicillium soppii TaxID=69789 RepID=UPI002546C1AA|nr:ankyrin [Penicillium soppii]KAJ5865314.1 ankyrin [Penicillium soppii]